MTNRADRKIVSLAVRAVSSPSLCAALVVAGFASVAAAGPGTSLQSQAPPAQTLQVPAVQAPTIPEAAAAAADSSGADPAAPAATPAEAPLEEIIIRAREPRYVERTRRDHIGRIWAPVYIDGQGPFRLVLDTGATRTAVVERVVSVLGAKTAGEPEMRLRGVTGTATVHTIPVRRVEFGELRVQTQRLPVLRDAFGGADGVLGTEGLADRRVYIDFENDLIHISHSHGERAPVGYITVPFDLTGGHLLVTDAHIGGVRTRMIIDTGAQVSVGNLALRNALRRRHGDHYAVNSVEGVTLDEESTEQRSVPTIHIADLQLSMEFMQFADLQIFKYWHMTDEPVALIGMDVLGLLDRLVIDYSRRELQLRLSDSHGG
ncbi:MAG: hypothetical protein RL684_1277 [Pseudomonadota bacterium]